MDSGRSLIGFLMVRPLSRLVLILLFLSETSGTYSQVVVVSATFRFTPRFILDDKCALPVKCALVASGASDESKYELRVGVIVSALIEGICCIGERAPTGDGPWLLKEVLFVLVEVVPPLFSDNADDGGRLVEAGKEEGSVEPLELTLVC
jgi:hypothetical protein